MKIIVLPLLVAALAAPATASGGTPNGYRETNARIICQVFGKYCRQALVVARCESGFSHWARNGQYLGLFQMGSYARARYGHSWSPWGQAKYAFRYFIAAGADWSPWACKPW